MLHSTVQVGRGDRDLVKNLVVGYVVADDTKRGEILRWAGGPGRASTTVLSHPIFSFNELGRTS